MNDALIRPSRPTRWGAGGGFDPVELIGHNTAIDATAGRSQLEDDLSTLLAEADRRDL